MPGTSAARSASAAPHDAPADLERRVAALREGLFDLVDAARAALPAGRDGDVHVSLLGAANLLGDVERALTRGE